MALSGGRPFTERAALCEQGIAEAGRDHAPSSAPRAQLGPLPLLHGRHPRRAIGHSGWAAPSRAPRRRAADRDRAVARGVYLETFLPGLSRRTSSSALLDGRGSDRPRRCRSIKSPLAFCARCAARWTAATPARGRAILQDCLAGRGRGRRAHARLRVLSPPAVRTAAGRDAGTRPAASPPVSFGSTRAQAHDPDYRASQPAASAASWSVTRGEFERRTRLRTADTLHNRDRRGRSSPYTDRRRGRFSTHRLRLWLGTLDSAARRLGPLLDRMHCAADNHKGILVTPPGRTRSSRSSASVSWTRRPGGSRSTSR